MTHAEKTRQAITNQVEELKTLRDEIRLELHLAGMELKDEWQKIERELPDQARAAEQLRDAASEGLDALVSQLRKFKERLREKGASQSRWPG